MDPTASAKTSWSILKTLLFHQGKYVTDFKKKAELFNSFFARQCSIIKNSSKRPLTVI